MKIPLTPIRFLRYAEQQFPNKLGVVCGDVRLTYAQFADRARRLAGGLARIGRRSWRSRGVFEHELPSLDRGVLRRAGGRGDFVAAEYPIGAA